MNTVLHINNHNFWQIRVLRAYSHKSALRPPYNIHQSKDDFTENEKEAVIARTLSTNEYKFARTFLANRNEFARTISLFVKRFLIFSHNLLTNVIKISVTKTQRMFIIL